MKDDNDETSCWREKAKWLSAGVLFCFSLFFYDFIQWKWKKQEMIITIIGCEHSLLLRCLHWAKRGRNSWWFTEWKKTCTVCVSLQLCLSSEERREEKVAVDAFRTQGNKYLFSQVKKEWKGMKESKGKGRGFFFFTFQTKLSKRKDTVKRGKPRLRCEQNPLSGDGITREYGFQTGSQETTSGLHY